MRVVIVGGGVAGTTAAEELKKQDPSLEVVLISEEPLALYSRVLLPHYIKGKVPRERVFLKKESWYEENNIEWLPGISVTSLDPDNAFVSLSDGRELPYDRLIIATGGDVRHLPFDLRGVSYFRNLDDTEHMLQLLNETPSGSPAVVYGGGFIACEYIDLFAYRSLPTTICFRGKHFWNSVLSNESGELINNHLKKNGVTVLPDTVLEKVLGEKELTGVITSNGELPAKILGVGMGIELDRSWIEKAGVECNRGIKTNEFFETNLPNIYAIGDAVEFYDPTVERSIQAGNWLSAIVHGRTVAKTITGNREEIKLVSSYSTNALGLEMIFIGDTNREAADKVVLRGKTEDTGITELFIRSGCLVGAVLLGRNSDRAPLTKWIQSKEQIESHLDRIQNPNEPLV